MNDWVYGCMNLGGPWSHAPLQAEDIRKASLILDSALTAGFRIFDHADIYGLGKAEQAFGAYLNTNPGLRSSIRIQSKAGILPGAATGGSNRYSHERDHLLRAVEASVRRMSCGYLDVFLLHRPDPLTPLNEVIRTFHTLKSEGLVRTFGVSNMVAGQVAALQALWPEPLVTNQIRFSLGHRFLIESEVTGNTASWASAGMSGLWPMSARSGLTLQAWGAVDRGRYLDPNARDPHTLMVHQHLQFLAESYGSSPLGMALAWVARTGVIPVVGHTDPARIHEAARAHAIQMSREDWYNLWVLVRNEPLP